MRTTTILVVAFAFVCWASPSLAIEIEKKAKVEKDPKVQVDEDPKDDAPSAEVPEGQKTEPRFLPQAPLFRQAILRRQKIERAAAQGEIARQDLPNGSDDVAEQIPPLDVTDSPETVHPLFLFLGVLALGLGALRLRQGLRR